MVSEGKIESAEHAAIRGLMNNIGPDVENIVRARLLDIFKAQIETHARGTQELEELSIIDHDSVGSW